MKLRFVILTSLILTTSNIYAQTVKKCDVGVVLFAKDKMGHLSQREVSNFLLTFGRECRNNVEYSEFSNEVLFDLIDRQTELVLKTMEKEKNEIELNVILENLGTPINDAIDVKTILTKVERVKMNGRLKDKIVERLKSAGDMN